ncbi:MAG: zinc ribbon domain-containing protein [Candidatus Omnitrophica bacterium]|nr:zinc ribbon domain-containing protein [Candidatus Omnitrophota bacterium]
MKKCPYCAEAIQDEALKCRFCGEFLVKKPQNKWYFAASFLIIAFLCIGPLMLPLVWFNPALARDKKIIITVIITVISIILGIILVSSIKSVSNYYKQIFSLTY